MCNQGSQRTSSRLESVSLNFYFKKPKKLNSLFRQKEKCVSVILGKHEVTQCTELCRPTKCFLILATTSVSLQQQQNIGERPTHLKKTQKTFQLFWPFINIMFWQLRIGWEGDDVRYPAVGAQWKKQTQRARNPKFTTAMVHTEIQIPAPATHHSQLSVYSNLTILSSCL